LPPVGLIDFSVGAGGEHAHGNDRAHACGRDEATSHSA
jgi:hypothetical protein